MKRYLLIIMMMVCAVTGAWANVTYPYNFGTGSSVDYNSTTGVMTVNIATTGDFQTFVDKLSYSTSTDDIDLNKTVNLRINCTNNATISSTEVTNLKNKRDNFSLLDLTDAAFDADATISSLITVNYLAYVALPQGKDISDVTLKDDGSIKGVVTSNGSSAIYTAYNGAADANFSKLFIGSSLQNIGTWTITNGAASGYITAGAETGNILTAIVSNSTATILNITLDGITNSPTNLAPSSSITNLTISGIQYPNDYENLTINGGSALTTLTLEDTTIPGSLTIDGCPELVTADLRGVRKKPNDWSTKLDVTVKDDPKLSNLILYKSSTETECHVSGTTPKEGSGLTVTYALPAIPIEYHDCQVTINRDFATGTMSSLITEAKNHLGSTNICTLIVTGELTTTDLESLDDANAARIDLSEATLATSAAITSLQVTSTLESLVLPPNQTVKGTTLETKLSTTNCPNLLYAYSPSSDCTATGPNQADETKSTYSYDATKNTIADYVWVNKAGGLKQAFENEEQLRNSFYIKVASDVALTETDVNFNGCTNKPTNYLFLDFSESNLTPAVAASYTVTDNIGYRIILPNGWTGNQMAVFAANPHSGNLAAVYSYDGTKLNIMEINDGAYSQAALANPRIMRSGTTEVDVVSGYYDGNTYAQFGTNLLAALNNMGKSNFSVTTKNAQNEDVVTNYTNTLGQSVKTISIETTSAAPNALTFDNPSITTLKAENLVQNNAELNVSACSALTSLSVKGSNLKSVTASGNTTITSADLSGTAIATTTNFNGATALATFTTTSESIFNGNVDLTRSALTGFTSEARFGGNINFNASSSLASINLSGATIASTSVVHIDKDATEATENTSVIDALKESATKTIKLPSSFPTDAVTLATRIHPYTEAAEYIEVASPVALAYNITTTDMTFHDKEAGDNTDHYRYWYQGTADSQKILTLGTSDSRRLSGAIAAIPGDQNYSTTQYAKIKVVGPLTLEDITSLKGLNCTALDLSEATYGGSTVGETIGELLKASFSDTETLGVHSNVKFIALPDSCTRDYILNEKALAGLKNSVYCVIAVNETSDGKDLTSYSFQSGSLQPAVVAFQNSAANSWTKILSTEENATRKYTSTVSNFKKLKISGLINSYDLSKANQKLDADGHLAWKEDVVESTDQTRTLIEDDTNIYAYNVYGPFSSCFLLTEIDLRDAYFEPKSGQTVDENSVYFRYWYSDMTLSFLDIISTATYKVVIPQNSKVREIPADFMRCSTNIRAICIPSNIQAIRTRAFYTIDYVWTTADAYATGSTTADPEGNNTKLDNGAKLSNGTAVSALLYENGKYKENPGFQNSYYTADYSGVDGGGTYTFGSTLKLIETGAFANTQPNVSDVYVLNKTAPECHVDAFNTVMYTGNGGYNSAKVTSEGIITRDAYYNGRWITMLHYPRQTTTPQLQRYTDPTREYSIATGMRDGKGATLYLPNQSEFIRAYQQGTYGYVWNAWDPAREYGSVNNGTLTNTTAGWTASGQSTANALFNEYTSGGTDHKFTSFYKVNQTGVTDVPSAENRVEYYNVYWSDAAYKYSNSAAEGYLKLYPQSEKDQGIGDADNSGEMTTKDYRGWHQFVLNAYAANTVLKEEPYRSYITDDDWWTVCLPFSLTRAEAIQIFGTEAKAATVAVGEEGEPGYVPAQAAVEAKLPYVSRLLYVIRDLNTANISLCFSKNLMEHSEGLGSDNTKQHGTAGTNGVVTITEGTAPGSSDIVMAAGVPYLIKPAFPMTSNSYNRQFRVYNSTDYAKLSPAQQNAVSPRAINNTNLYNRIKASEELSGNAQRTLIQNGVCKVPVFMPNGCDDRVTPENGEGEYKIGDGVEKYKKSTDWYYAFVGTFYKSFMPQYSYYLGWNGTHAQFFYKTSAKENVMTWMNETGVIIPTKGSEFSAEVTEATDMQHPAQWLFFDNNNATTLVNDAFTIDNGSGPIQQSKNYDMLLDADNVTIVTGVETPEVAVPEVIADGNGAVYNISGQKVDASRNALPKGIYIQNGKKYVVK